MSLTEVPRSLCCDVTSLPLLCAAFQSFAVCSSERISFLADLPTLPNWNCDLQAARATLCSDSVFYFFSKNPIFLLAQSPQAAVGQESSHLPPTPSSPTSCVCSLLIPAASQLDAAVKKSSHGSEKRDFHLRARKRDSSKRGKLPEKGFVPGCGAAAVLLGADPFLHGCSSHLGASLATLHLHVRNKPIFHNGLSAWCDKCA